jgi:hypothetical protein
MSDERTCKRMQQEIAEADNPRARYQAILDQWHQQRQAASRKKIAAGDTSTVSESSTDYNPSFYFLFREGTNLCAIH